MLTASRIDGTPSSELCIAVKANPAEPVKTTTPEPVKMTTPEPVKTTPPAPVATAPVLPSMPKASVKLGQPYSPSVAASSTIDVTYGLQGKLPVGLTLNSDSGVITGTLKASGTFAFSVQGEQLRWCGCGEVHDPRAGAVERDRGDLEPGPPDDGPTVRRDDLRAEEGRSLARPDRHEDDRDRHRREGPGTSSCR